MKMSLELDPTLVDPNMLGELFRELTFPGDGYGCYTTFETREDATPLSPDLLRLFWQEYCAEKRKQLTELYPNRLIRFDVEDDEAQVNENVLMGRGCHYRECDMDVWAVWAWDGDGHLVFRFRDEQGATLQIENRDCKKSYNWELV